ncbi:MAG: Crp/Fnr family transcriptional regulator [Bacteroidales bacterium]|nr:Crp/Fnr family transcriptional regulator [Bacteroidales bacterium]
MSQYSNCLLKSPFFKGLTEAEIEKFLADVHHNYEKYSKDDILHLVGETVDRLQIVVEGCVRGEMIDASGKTFIMEDICACRAISPGFLYGKYNRYPVNVVASESSIILSIPEKELSRILPANPVILRNFLDMLSDKTQYLALKIKGIFLQNLEGKIASLLLDLSHQNESCEFELPKSQEAIAERFNVARPSVARAFSEIKSKGYIEMSGRKVKIIDPKGLRDCINKM